LIARAFCELEELDQIASALTPIPVEPIRYQKKDLSNLVTEQYQLLLDAQKKQRSIIQVSISPSMLTIEAKDYRTE
jgi:hypothetical protein